MRKIIVLLVVMPLTLLAWKMESGTITLPATTAGSTTWQHVDFQQSYDAPPLVFAMPNEGSGYSGDDPAALRVENITADGFDIVQVEPQGQDGPHSEMAPIHYVAIDLGEHTLPDGTKIVAGTVDTAAYQGKNASGTKSWKPVTFPSSFVSTPLVFGMIQTVNNEQNAIPGEVSVPWMVTAINNIDSNGFDTALDMVKTSDGTITQSETIAYLAILPDIQGNVFDIATCDAVAYETLKTDESISGWDDSCTGWPFNNSYSSNPNVLGGMQTRNGGDGGWLRRCSLSTTQVDITVDEDISVNDRTHPVKEVAGMFVFTKDFAYDSIKALSCGMVIEYRMDECYWLGTGNFDVLDTAGGNDAEAYNNAQPDKNDAVVNFSGGFGATGYIQPDTVQATGNEWTYAVWLKFPLDTTGHDDFPINGTNTPNNYFYFALGSIANQGDLPALLKENVGNDLMWDLYDAAGNDTVADLPDDLATTNGGWHHFAFVQENGETSLYLDGSFYNKVSASISGDIEAYLTSLDNADGQTVGTNADEVKFWNRPLAAQEIANIESNESNGYNYDGTTREPVTCSASITANSWEMISIPVDSRSSTIGVQDVFGDDFNGANYDAGNSGGWILWKRQYHAGDNLADWVKVDYANNEPVEFGRGYFLGSTVSATWDTDGQPAVDYDSAYSGTAECPGRCVEIDLTSVSTDGTDGSGMRRYNLSGFTGLSPVDWADCRFIIDGTLYTPEAAENAGYASRTIAQWGGGAGSGTGGQVLDSEYAECTDTSANGCTLNPYHGVWVELFTPTLGKTVKLLIPQE